MGTPRIRRATEEDSGALATLVPGLVPEPTDEHHATFVIVGPGGPVAVLDLLQTARHLELLHLSAPDVSHAQALQDFAEHAARALKAREIRLGPRAMGEAQAIALGYSGGAKRVRPDGVPLWRDGTAGLTQSLYYRGVWAAIALLIGLGSVSVAVFSRGELTLMHIVLPAVLCAVGTLFAFWQILLIVQASRRSRPWMFALSAVVALGTVGLIGLTVHDRAVPALSELWAIHTGDTELGHISLTVSQDERTLYVLGSYGLDSGDEVVKLLDRHPRISEIVLGGPGGRAGAGRTMFNAFRKKRLATRVDHDCFSACTVAFLGGVQRGVGPEGRLGFHRASFPGMSDSDMYEIDLAERRFLAYRANLTPDFIDRVMKTPPESIWIPTREELLAGKVITR